MSDIALHLPINGVSFGQVSTALLREFYQKGVHHFWVNAYLIAVSVILAFQLSQFNVLGEWFVWCFICWTGRIHCKVFN